MRHRFSFFSPLWDRDIFKNLKEDLEKLEGFFEDFEAGSLKQLRFKPDVDIYEKNNNLVVEAELPGFNPEDIEIEIKDNVLTLRGEVKEEKEKKEENFWQRERRYGRVQRTVSLPVPVDETKAEAEFKNGVLIITLPKTKEAKGRKIQIKKKK